MKDKKNEVANGVSLQDATRMREIFNEIGKLSFNNQLAVIKMANKRLKAIRLAAEVNAYEENLYVETHRRAKETKPCPINI